MNVIGNSWDAVLDAQYREDYFKTLMERVDQEYITRRVYPPYNRIFAALKAVDYDAVKVVILGQDPYHREGQATGMAFAVSDGVELPPSLANIFKEIESDLGVTPDASTLDGWAKQGVLLLNSVLTVRQGKPQSHALFGWQRFTDAIIAAISMRERPAVFILWGANAIGKEALIDARHLLLTAPHPSPLSAYRGFFGCKHFSKANAFLLEHGMAPIDWGNASGVEKAAYYSAPGRIIRV